ncbi:MAG TPA: hypothetical protein VFD36_20640 [Kofleriaceae bacterium]|nr:hypothetical protein [Kofleriaceae bacterium]
MIVATLASLSSREAQLAKTIASLEPQVDAICVYLNGYTRVPECLKIPKVVHAVLSLEAGWRGAEAKLWFWDDHEFKAAPRWKPDDIALVCDDDIVYPQNYADKMTAALAERPGTVACVHGSIMDTPFERYCVSRMVARTVASLHRPTQVHIPGTGTMAFRVGDVAPHLHLREQFVWSHAVDPHVAVLLHQRKIPVWSVARPPRWLQVQVLPREGTQIFPTRTGAANDVHETAMLKAAEPWPELAIPTDMTPRTKQISRLVIDRGQSRKAVVATPNPASELPAEAIAWIADKVAGAPDGYVIELGSGFGTDKLAQALPPNLQLVSVEHDEAFVGLSDLAAYIHAPIWRDWYDVRKLRAQLPPKDEIRAVIVDGPPAKIGRRRLFKHLDLFPAVPMVVDDVHRPADRALAARIAASRDIPMQVHELPDRAFATIG